MTDGQVFEQLYRDSPDPWGFETRWYERRKHRVTVATLPRERYARAFEPGCGNGVLAALLGERCEHLLAVDVSATAAALARERLANRDGVVVEQRAIPADWPDGAFDLIVLSELAYFLTRDELDAVLDRVRATLERGGDLVVVDWSGPVDGYELDGAAVHARVADARWLRRLARHVEEQFVLEVFRA